MLTVQEALKQYDITDAGILSHGFTEYNRDYRMKIVYIGFTGEHNEGRLVYPATLLFRGCVEARYESVIGPRSYPGFMDDCFLDARLWEEAGRPEGIHWCGQYADAYPGWEEIVASAPAAAWTERMRMPFHEVVIETNLFRLALVFHDLTVETFPPAESLAAHRARG